MPAFATHYIFARELIPEIKKSADFALDENAVKIGTQGPDIFFFGRVMPWQTGTPMHKIGSAFHRCKFGDTVDNFRKYLKISKSSGTAKSYIYGFFMHYALDRTCHPFIYFLQNKITDQNIALNPNTVHNFIESGIDSVFINERLGLRPREFSGADDFNFTQGELDEISSLLEFCKSSAEPYTYTKKQAAQAVRDTREIQKALFDPRHTKQILTHPLELAAGPFTHNFWFTSFLKQDNLKKCLKYINISNGVWHSPFGGGQRQESFYDLFDKAKADALKMISCFESGKTGYEITHNISFLTGEEVK